MPLVQDRHSRSLLSGDLRQKTQGFRLKRLEDNNYNKYQSDLHRYEK